MRKLTFSRVLHGVAHLAGLDRDNLSTNEFARIRDLADGRLAVAWETGYWPDIVLAEKRRFRPLWDSSATYTAGTEVYYAVEDKYYFATASANTDNAPTGKAWWGESSESPSGDKWVSGTAYGVGDTVHYKVDDKFYWCYVAHTASGSVTPTDTSKWAELVPFDRYIGLEQTGETKIGEVLGVTQKDPDNFTTNKRYSFTLSPSGIQVLDNVGTVWVRFRKRRPDLKGDAWSSTTTYAAGDQVYFSEQLYDANQSTLTGESPTTASTKWDLVEVPYIFQGYLIRGAYADYLRSTGNNELAAQADADAEAVLAVEADKLLRQQGQVERVNVLTY
tara:strand:+ start:3491 stop:4489 length:999 start_codon:yes stop_codon:yes gene_type:complete